MPDFPYAGSVHRKSDLFYPIFYDQQPCSRQPVFFKAGCVPSLCVAVCHRIWSAAGDFLGPAGDCGLLFPPDVPSERTGGADGLQYLHLDGTAFILGMVVGYMRDQILQIKKDDEEEIGYLRGQLGDMTEINDSNVRMKQLFELQLVNQKDSLGKIYEITSSLERYGAYEVLFYAAQTISKLMNTEDVAIYTVANRVYARLFSFTSPTARKMGNSIRYPEMEAMYEDLKEHRVYINKTMDERYPLMAQAIYAEDEMQIILMLWGLPWDRMNLAESNRLTVISYLIQNAVVRANRYLEALHEHRYLEHSKILEKDAFTQLVAAFFEAKRNGLTECSLVRIVCSSEDYKKAGEILEQKLRQTDYIGILDGGLHVLLSNTDEENAKGVILRFGEEGLKSILVNREVAA